MAYRVTMVISIQDDDDVHWFQPASACVLHQTEPHALHISREMIAHFQQVIHEDPAARAVADALSRPERQANPWLASINVAMDQMRKAGEEASTSMEEASTYMNKLVATIVMRTAAGQERLTKSKVR